VRRPVPTFLLGKVRSRSSLSPGRSAAADRSAPDRRDRLIEPRAFFFLRPPLAPAADLILSTPCPSHGSSMPTIGAQRHDDRDRSPRPPTLHRIDPAWRRRSTGSQARRKRAKLRSTQLAGSLEHSHRARTAVGYRGTATAAWLADCCPRRRPPRPSAACDRPPSPPHRPRPARLRASSASMQCGSGGLRAARASTNADGRVRPATQSTPTRQPGALSEFSDGPSRRGRPSARGGAVRPRRP
jgi:hypothetical protein